MSDAERRALERRAKEGDPAARELHELTAARYDFKLPPVHAAQRAILESPARFKVVVAGRRFRKSSLGVLECVKAAASGKHVWWVAPTHPLARIGWRMAVGIAKQLQRKLPDGYVQVRKGEGTIAFGEAGWLQVKSVEAGDCIGEGIDLVVIDEAARIRDPEVWEQQIRPALSDRRGRALFISTPKGDNWFRRLYEFACSEAGARDNWAAWQFPSSANPYMRADEIAEAQRLLPAWVFAQEYLAEFTVPGGGMFKHANHRFYRTVAPWIVELAHGTQVERYDLLQLTRFATVDLAASVNEAADYTVISSWAATSTGKLLLLDLVRGRFEVPDIMPALMAAVARWRLDFAAIESVAFQLGFVQDARRHGLPARELERDRGRLPMTDTPANVAAKVARAMPAAVMHASHQVWFPEEAHGTYWPELERELENFPLVEHDDEVDTLSDAVSIVREVSSYMPPSAPDTGAGRSSTPLSDAAPSGSPWG